MMKKIIISLISFIIIIFCILNTSVFATTLKSALGTLTHGATVDGDFNNMANRILGAAQLITILGGIIVIAAIGLKYMLGSADEKAVTKKSWIPLIIGICVAMCATTFARIMYNVFSPSAPEKVEKAIMRKCKICEEEISEITWESSGGLCTSCYLTETGTELH